MVNVLAFYSPDRSSNVADAYTIFPAKFVFKKTENKQNNSMTQFDLILNEAFTTYCHNGKTFSCT